MIQLDGKQWVAMHMRVLARMLAMTHTKDDQLKATMRDRAKEATQRALDRFLRVQPADVETVEQVYTYLVRAARSEMYNEGQENAVRTEHEAEAMGEAVHLGQTKSPSAEAMQVEAADDRRRKGRAETMVRLLREELAGDSLALGTIDCIARGVDKPADQARELKCSVEEIHKARKRRQRAAARVLEALKKTNDEEEVA